MNFIADDINHNQHGFANGKSILSNLLESIDTINKYLKEVDIADIIYLDFSKAFDMVSNYCLLEKIKNLGISKNILQ